MNIRNLVLENVIAILEEKKPLHLVLQASLNGIEDSRDRGFAARLTRGCVERAVTLDFCLNRLSKLATDKQKPVIRNILRCGLYQILFMDSVSDFAACDESVKLAVKRGFGRLKGVVNGILRNACRSREELLSIINAEGKDNFCVRYSVPKWIADDLTGQFGSEKTEGIFRYFLKENPVHIRGNISKGSAETVFEKLEKAAIPSGSVVKRNRYVDYCFTVERAQDSSAIDITDTKAFKDGAFVVQDFSSVLVGYVADRAFTGINGNNKSGIKGRVLDLCAAPGGKSMHLADLGFEVTACDVSQSKLKLIREAAARCGFDKTEILENDASVYNKAFENAYDMVICDLPCSGLGIIGKKPDIKYNMTEAKSGELAILQRKILENAVRYVKENGILIFSTCTLRTCENADNVAFIKEIPNMEGMPIAGLLPEGIAAGKDDCFVQILPGEYDSDGFWISCFKKKA